MIRCHQLTRRFHDFEAVRSVSFEIPRGICALLGPNGAGKSTVVKMLTGLLAPTSGVAQVCGIDPQSHAIRQTVGVLPESLSLFYAITVGEHLDLTGRIYGLSAAEARARSADLLSALRLSEAQNTFLHQCSYGTKKKTALALALLPNPPALFLDEPFEGIDPITAETIRLLLLAAARRGVTVLLTSHILSLVDSIADRVILIDAGAVKWNSTVDALPKSLPELYFELVDPRAAEELNWLGSKAR